MTSRCRAKADAGDVVGCRIADDLHPLPEARPALVLAICGGDAPHAPTPQRGTLHPLPVRAVQTAFRAAAG